MDTRKCLSLVLTLVVVVLQPSFAFEKALERVKLEGHDNHDIDIFVERRISYLHSMIDLRPTQDGLLLLEKCTLRFEQEANTPLSRTLANQIGKKSDRIASKLSRVIEPQQTKNKRSIEIIGDLWSDLFGNPGPTEWKQTLSNVVALKNAIQRVDDNANINHADIDTNRHAIEKQNSNIKSIVSIVSKNRAELTKVDDDVAFLKSYHEILTLADAVETQVDFLIEVKVDSLKGFCNDRAVSRTFLVDNLLTLEANKVGLAPVFGSWEWRKFYKNRMCSVALEGGNLWVTLRIPIVKKSEKMVRVIPSPEVNKILRRAADYGLRVTLFKESVNEKYHVMTQTSLDLCNILGTTRTCSVREAKFSVGQLTVMPIEFSLNRFLILGMKPMTFKVMSICPNGITEHSISTDTVWLVPNNCSYSSSYLSIDVRESDVAITKEIGIIHFDKFEVSQVQSSYVNNSIIVEEVLNGSKSSTFERNRIEIREKLDGIKTSHESLLSQYSYEKWFIASSVLLLAMMVVGVKLQSIISRRRLSRSVAEGIELGQLQSSQVPICQDLSQQQQPVHPQQQQQQIQQLQPQQQQQQRPDNDLNDVTKSSHVYSEIAAAGSVSFSSRPELSQFYSKN